MKKIKLILLIALFAMNGCQKKIDDTIGGQTVDERLSAALVQYQNMLTSAPYGWKVFQKTGIAYNGGASDSVKSIFTYYMQFTDTNTVSMYGDFDTLQATVKKTSTYRLKALQRPTILFDTYSYLHVPCDPDPSISKSPLDAGLGWGTDFDFEFADNLSPSQLTDTIHLKGLANEAKVYMVRATQQEQAVYTSGQYGNNLKGFHSISKILTYWKRFTIGSTIYEIGQADLVQKKIMISWLDGSGNLKSVSTGFYYGFDGNVILLTPVVNGSTTITGFSNCSFNGTGVDFKIMGPDVTSTIVASKVALKLDLNAPSVWWNLSLATGDYYYSVMGFHVNGIDDYFGVTKLAGWWYMLFWAKYNVSGSTWYDAFSGAINGSITGQATYTPNPTPASSSTITYFTTDGRIIFKSFGSFGSGTSILNTTVKTQILDASGYYLVKTGPESYDMVGAKDAQAWISWELW